MARPTKYKPEYCQEIVEFFKIEPHKWDTLRRKEVANELPTFSRFEIDRNLSIGMCSRWAKKHKKFFQAYKKAKALQKDFLITNGLLGLYNPTFAIFTAKNITDMRDVSETKSEQTLILKIDKKDVKNLTEGFKKVGKL